MQIKSKAKDNSHERRNKILDLVTEKESISVGTLARALEVSLVTVRADLAALEEEGALLRSHGGASPAFHPAIAQRMRNRREAKAAIAKAAAQYVEDDDTIMIAAGTTTALIPRYLRGKRNVHIVTNNTLLLPYVRTNPLLQVTLVGGTFRPAEESLTGPLTMEAVERFHVARAFLGIDGADPRLGVFANSVESAGFVRQMASHAAQIIVLADSAKFQTPGFVHILPFDRIDLLITDDQLPADVERYLLEHNVKLIKTMTRSEAT